SLSNHWTQRLTVGFGQPRVSAAFVKLPHSTTLTNALIALSLSISVPPSRPTGSRLRFADGRNVSLGAHSGSSSRCVRRPLRDDALSFSRRAPILALALGQTPMT